jgi:NAD(P)-dependent dehydrogenase (short-subunit alcohol dehydrogenase family)
MTNGTNILITGGTSGIGLAAAQILAKDGATLLVTSRDERRGAEAVRALRDLGARADFIAADFSRMRDVVRFGRRLTEERRELDAVIHSAGPLTSSRVVTEDGLELLYAAQYLARFALNRALAPVLERRGGRVISVAGGGSYTAEIAWDDLDGARSWNMTKALVQTSVMNDLLGLELARRHPELRSYVYGPGLVTGTGLTASLPWGWRAATSIAGLAIGTTPQVAGADVARLVTADLAPGLYRRKLVPSPVRPYLRDELLRARLWDHSADTLARVLSSETADAYAVRFSSPRPTTRGPRPSP